MAEVQPEEPRYVFGPGQRSIFTEIYFPRHAAYQGKIFDALQDGYSTQIVRKYLSDYAVNLLMELAAYPQLFDPYRYRRRQPQQKGTEIEQARVRIAMYRSPFRGWSLYQVDGVFFNRRGRIYEEAAQVVRIMFREESSLRKKAEAAGCADVLRAIRYWTIDRPTTITEGEAWSTQELGRFLARHEPMPEHKRVFAEEFFELAVKEASKWIDDCALFIFGYLVRTFWKGVLAGKIREEEIWVTSFFDLTVNVVKRMEGR